jgi:hypothetical protein
LLLLLLGWALWRRRQFFLWRLQLPRRLLHCLTYGLLVLPLLGPGAPT